MFLDGILGTVDVVKPAFSLHTMCAFAHRRKHMAIKDKPHRRYNPLSGEWILVSPHRTKRPWQGAHEKPSREIGPSYDPDCYLCPGNERAGGEKNPSYTDTFVFTNDYAALLPDTEPEIHKNGMLEAQREKGICKVICFSPRHDLTLSRMEPAAIRTVIDTWDMEYRSLASEPFISYVQIFENRGAAMGCSNPHPHGQIWSSESVPQIPQREGDMQRAWRDTHHSCRLCDYLNQELKEKERIVLENEYFAALVPWWAVWPFEMMIIPKRHVRSIDEFTGKERDQLSMIMRDLGVCFDNLFKTSFPYSMGIHQAPSDGDIYPEWHLHFHYFPPLLRSASVKKHMVGYELLASPQRDLTAEKSAERLRSLPAVHYLDLEE